MSISEQRGNLSLMPKKKDKDKKYHKIWRPISPMNSNYKSSSKPLALCLEKNVTYDHLPESNRMRKGEIYK